MKKKGKPSGLGQHPGLQVCQICQGSGSGPFIDCSNPDPEGDPFRRWGPPRFLDNCPNCYGTGWTVWGLAPKLFQDTQGLIGEHWDSGQVMVAGFQGVMNP